MMLKPSDTKPSQDTTRETNQSPHRPWLESDLCLPADHPRPPVSSFLRGTESSTFEKTFGPSIQQFCNQNSIEVFNLFCSAISLFLWKFTGQEDIQIGTIARSVPRHQLPTETSSFTILPLQIRLHNNPRGHELLTRTSTSVHSAFDDLDFAEMMMPDVEALPFTHMIFAKNFPDLPSSLNENTEAAFSLEQYFMQCEVNFSIAAEQDRLCVVLEYDRELFEPSTIRRWVHHITDVVHFLIEDQEHSITDFSFVRQKDRHQLFVTWNQTKAPTPQLSLHHVIERQCKKTPDRIAVMDDRQSYTYSYLNQQADRVAQHLRSQGVQTESLVGIFLDPSVDVVVALLGTLKAGGAYLPLDPEYPSDRVGFILTDSNAQFILTHRAFLPTLPKTTAKIICLDEIAHSTHEPYQSLLTPTLSMNNLAYVIYTSGSTGQPKAICVSHHNLVGILTALHQESGLTHDDVLFALTTLAFDISAMELFLPLFTGGQVILANPKTRTDGQHILQRLKETGTTAVQATPATWLMLLQNGLSTHPPIKKFCGGDVLPASSVLQLLQNGPDLWNFYGPTETTIWATANRMTSGRDPVPIGRPLHNVSIYLLDDNFHPVPIGATGDLFISGVGVARGYYNHPAFTARAFVPHPFSQSAGDRLYQTGDRARYRNDGTLEFIGRQDTQIKLRGFRIELREIESVLQEHPRVLQTVIRPQTFQDNDVRLIAYLVVDNGYEDMQFGLREFLMKKLPTYMVPSHFVFLKTLPLTNNGKINRRALPDYDSSPISTNKTFVAPEGMLEEVLANIWRDVFQREQIGRHENFFELGGHSLLMTQVVARIRDYLEVGLPLRSFFAHPTIAGQAQVIDLLSGESHEPVQDTNESDIMGLLDQMDRHSRDELVNILSPQKDFKEPDV